VIAGKSSWKKPFSFMKKDIWTTRIELTIAYTHVNRSGEGGHSSGPAAK
jgi:hypothetical protein